MRRYVRAPFAVLVSSLCLLLAAPPASASVNAEAAESVCSTQRVTVTLSTTDSTPYQVVGRLCLSALTGARGQTVQLLQSGLTYGSSYFDSSYKPATYSYVATAQARGYSTFNIDRLGIGLSDHPPGKKLTGQAHAHVAGQIVRQLRSGAIGGRAFRIVVGVGHSFGTGVFQYLAGTSNDAAAVPDYLVAGSFLMATYGNGSARLAAALHPASSDPKFASRGLDADYLTTQPGTRGPVFYNLGSADPAMIQLDETDKQTGTSAERASIPAIRTPAVTRGIQVPVLLTVGQYDNLYCDEASGLSCANNAVMKAREAPNYTARACLSTFVVAGAGHAVGGHLRAMEGYNAALDWTDRYTQAQPGEKDGNGCLPI